MRRIIPAVLLTAVLLLGSCSSGAAPAATPTPTKTGTPTPVPSPSLHSLYNGVFGIEIEMPQDWVVQFINEKNLTETAEASSVAEDLDVFVYDNGGCGMELLELWSKNDSSDADHASFSAFIEAYEGVTEQEYIDATAEAFAGDFEGYVSELKANDRATIGGRDCGHLKYRTETPEKNDVYLEEFFVVEVDAGTYAVFCVMYWENSKPSYNYAMEAIGRVSFTEAAVQP